MFMGKIEGGGNILYDIIDCIKYVIYIYSTLSTLSLHTQTKRTYDYYTQLV